MAWIESHQELREHPKIYRLMEILNISKPQAIGHLHLFWWWCVDYAPTGGLEGFNDLQLSRAGEWTGDPKVFINALVEARLLDRNDGVLTVHDWTDFCGELIKKRLLRVREKRRKISAERQKKSASRGFGSVGFGSVGKEKGESEGETAWPSVEKLVQIYNQQAADELPAVEILSEARRKKAKQYLAKFPKLDFWQEVFKETKLSAFLRGLKNGPGHENFKATLDWLLSKGKDGTENCVKVFEGRYRDAKN